jgi:hypothetical protein
MNTFLQHSDAATSAPSEITMLSENPKAASPEPITQLNEDLDSTAYSSQQSSNANIRSKDSLKAPSFSSSFYMCCQANPNSITIDHYYPPYACIFGPETGLCPQGINSSFIFPWLCTVDSNWGIGQIVRHGVFGRYFLEYITHIFTQNCTYKTSD